MLGVAAIMIATALAAGALRLLGRDGAQRLAEPRPRRGQNRRQPRRDRAASRGPIKSTLLEDSHRADVYAYEIGNEPSAGRATGHAVMDVLTLGLLEIVGTPIEGVQDEPYHATVVYDQNDRVIDLRTTKVASAM